MSEPISNKVGLGLKDASRLGVD